MWWYWQAAPVLSLKDRRVFKLLIDSSFGQVISFSYFSLNKKKEDSCCYKEQFLSSSGIMLSKAISNLGVNIDQLYWCSIHDYLAKSFSSSCDM